jgi:hypothetical protein
MLEPLCLGIKSLRSNRIFTYPWGISSSLKNETIYEDSFCLSVATSLKNETEATSIVFLIYGKLLKK